MNKIEIQKIAQDTFKANPEAKVCFITSDGFPFLSKNAADLHKNTNSKKKKLEVIEVKNDSFATSEEKGKEKVKPLSKMNLTELNEAAVLLGIEAPEGSTKAEIVKLIEDVTNKDIKE